MAVPVMKLFNRIFSPTVGECHIMRLPDELLAEIASYIPERHPKDKNHYVINSRSIHAFSATSHTLRSIGLPYLYDEVAIASDEQLHSLADAPDHLLARIRELNIFMDADFLNSFRSWAFGGPIWQSPYTALTEVFRNAKNLEALRIRVAQLTGAYSAWRRTPISRPEGIPLGLALTRALATTMPANRKLELHKLNILELDAFSDIAPLLRLTPNLQRLRLELSAGFAQCVNTEFIEALRHTPHLKELIYTPESLRVSSSPMWFDAILAIVDFDHLDGDGDEDSEEDRSAELLNAIGDKLSHLEFLDLQRRWYREDSVVFPRSEEVVTPEALTNAMENLPCLKYLALPTSVINTTDHSTLRSPFAIPPDPTASRITFRSSVPSASQIVTRRNALERTGATELKVIEQVSTCGAPQLEQVTFTRPVGPADRLEASVVYSRLTPIVSNTPAPWVQRILVATDGSLDPLPRQGGKRYPVCSVRRWKEATHGSYVPALAVAAGGGIVLGEALRGAYESGLLTNPNVIIWSALSATAATAALNA